MHRHLRHAILENLDTVRRLPVGRFWGVRVFVTPLTWLFPFIFFALRLGLNAFGPPLSLASRLNDAALFTVAVGLGTLVHALGHILGGKLVGSPMAELLLTATRGVNLYHGDQSALPGRVHLGRALGGPVLNLLVGLAFLALTPIAGEGPTQALLSRLAAVNLFFGAGAFLPLPSVDGEVIWREVRRWVRSFQVR